MNSFGSRSTLRVGSREFEICRRSAVEAHGCSIKHLPYSLRILLENLLRREDGKAVKADGVRALTAWNSKSVPSDEIAFMPSRVLLQDFTGVPAVVDLAALRDAMKALGGEPKLINPLVPVDLVIDHSVVRAPLGRTRSATASSSGASRPFPISRWCRPGPASATRSTSNISPTRCGRRRRSA